jgi:hypothetical protein
MTPPTSATMPTPASTTVLPSILLSPSPFRERLLLFLLPYFNEVAEDLAVARAEIFETLASYGARTRPELIQAARIIAFSFTALDLLAEVSSTEMSQSLGLRFRGCANGLNRSCQKDEQQLARRLACDLPNRTRPDDQHRDDQHMDDNAPDAEFEAALLQAKTEIVAYHNRLSGNRPATSPQPMPASKPERTNRPGASVMTNVLADLASDRNEV